MATATDVANLALRKIGSSVTVANITTDTTKAGKALNAWWAHIRKKEFEKNDWSFAIRQTQLKAAATITAATAANPVVVTAAAHPFINGDRIKIKDVVGMTEINDIVFLVANKTATTFELQDTDAVNIDGTAYTAYTSGGTANASPLFGRARYFNLPTGFLRALAPYTEDDVYDRHWSFEGVAGQQKLYTDDTTPLDFRYILDVTDPTDYPASFTQVLILALAMEIFPEMGQPGVTAKQDLQREYNEAINWARGIGAIQLGNQGEDVEDEWLAKRR